MKKVIAKVLAVALTAAMVVSMFAGCAKKSGSNPNVIRLTRDLFNIANPDSAQVKKVEDAINAYLKEKGKTYTVVITEYGSGEYTEKASPAFQAGQIDLLWTASWQSTIGTNDLVPQKSVKDITALLAGTDLYKSMDAGQWEATKYDGKNYFIPVYKDNVEGYDFMFRKEFVDAHDIDITTVKKLEDLAPILEMAKNDGLKYPLLLQKTAMFFRWYLNDFDFFTGNNSLFAVDRATNSVINPMTTTQYKEFATLIAKWTEAGYISEDEANKTVTDTTTQTKDWAVSWWTDVPDNGEATNRYKQDVVMTPATDRWAHSTSALGSCYCISAKASDELAKNCIDFLGMLYTDNKLADLYTYGIEGEDFKYIDNDGVKQVEKLDNAKYNHSMWESVSATIITPEKNSPKDYANLYTAFNGGAKTSCAAGFRFDKKPVEAKFAAVQTVFDEYGFGLETGAFKESEVETKIAEFQKALDDAGYQEVLAEFQKQYDAWKK